MRATPSIAALAGVALGLGATAAAADPTRRAERLEPLRIEAEAGLSPARFVLDSGVYYRWRIESDGLFEYRLRAPELFREAWIDKVVVDDVEIEAPALRAIAFGDEEGRVDIWFMPVRPGTYRFAVDGFEAEGFAGEMVVR